MLEIRNLVVTGDGKEIIRGVSLKIKPGEIHALMGPNGSGKSSLALSLAGHPRYKITSGEVKLDSKVITSLTPDKRANLGLFLAMQHPVAVPGVSVTSLVRKADAGLRGKKVEPVEIVKKVKKGLRNLRLNEDIVYRGINDGFSGGEKKKSEVLQLSILKPKYAILDEVDSGLDIDSLKTVAKEIKKVATPKVGILLITHYQRILKYIKPDFVHVLIDGQIAASGDYRLAEEVEAKGYQAI